jgi:hypothetical protein
VATPLNAILGIQRLIRYSKRLGIFRFFRYSLFHRLNTCAQRGARPHPASEALQKGKSSWSAFRCSSLPYFIFPFVKRAYVLLSPPSSFISFSVPKLARLDLCGTTVDKQLDAGHKTRVARSEKERSARDLFGLPHCSPRNERDELVYGLLSERLENWGINGAGTEHVDTDVASLEVHGPSPRKRADSRFACAVNAEAGEAFDARAGAVQDDGATQAELRPSLLSAKAARKKEWAESEMLDPEDVAGVVVLACTQSPKSRIIEVQMRTMAEALA